jgi:histone deacetylase 1/2
VDDIVVASLLEKAVDALLHDLGLAFALKDLADLHYFLGIEVKRCVMELLCLKKVMPMICFIVQIRKTVDTPLSVSDKLFLTDEEVLGSDDSTNYMSIVGLTRLDIAFSVNKVCQFLQALTTVHWTTRNAY